MFLISPLNTSTLEVPFLFHLSDITFQNPDITPAMSSGQYITSHLSIRNTLISINSVLSYLLRTPKFSNTSQPSHMLQATTLAALELWAPCYAVSVQRPRHQSRPLCNYLWRHDHNHHVSRITTCSILLPQHMATLQIHIMCWVLIINSITEYTRKYIVLVFYRAD